MRRLSFGLDKFGWARIFHSWNGFDFVFTICAIGIYLGCNHLKPFDRDFYINDLSISHAMATTERVSSRTCVAIALAVPIGTIIIVGGLLETGDRWAKLRLIYVSIMGVVLSLCVNGILTDILKNWIGRHRPDFLSRCEPDPSVLPDVLVTSVVCTTTNTDRLLDGMRSTPSGHSSTSFAGLYYLTLWLFGQFMAVRDGVEFYKGFIAIVPSIGAALIALSRTEDYRHHFLDVVLGSLLGMGVAWYSYRKFFPRLHSDVSFRPYGPPSFVYQPIFGDAHSSEYEDTLIAGDVENQIRETELGPYESGNAGSNRSRVSVAPSGYETPGFSSYAGTRSDPPTSSTTFSRGYSQAGGELNTSVLDNHKR